ncbi:MAG: DUF1573 domain-containing protein [Bacteroidetes bacterium]|nr:DUF1573 domain-containing protein [Bacteroidota bacterium]
MKSVLLFLVVGFIFFSCKTEISEAELGAKTTVKIEPIYTGEIPLETCDTVYQAGNVVKGQVINAKFKITNTGKIPLIIAGIKAGCGCTETTEVPDNPIAPGDYYIVEGKVKTAELTAKNINKHITIEANALPYPLTLRIKGTMK